MDPVQVISSQLVHVSVTLSNPMSAAAELLSLSLTLLYRDSSGQCVSVSVRERAWAKECERERLAQERETFCSDSCLCMAGKLEALADYQEDLGKQGYSILVPGHTTFTSPPLCVRLRKVVSPLVIKAFLQAAASSSGAPIWLQGPVTARLGGKVVLQLTLQQGPVAAKVRFGSPPPCWPQDQLPPPLSDHLTLPPKPPPPLPPPPPARAEARAAGTPQMIAAPAEEGASRSQRVVPRTGGGVGGRPNGRRRWVTPHMSGIVCVMI